MKPKDFLDTKKQRRQARLRVRIVAIGWLFDLCILFGAMSWGTDDYSYSSLHWSPGWVELSILTVGTIPFVLSFLVCSDDKRRKLLWIPALLHLPFIHYGIYFSIVYFCSIGVANNDLASRYTQTSGAD